MGTVTVNRTMPLT